MRHIPAADLPGLEKVFRLNLVNSITGYKPANLVGTADAHGATNLAIVSSVLHLGSNPALLGFVMRPTTVARHTYENIRATGRYTFNHVPTGQEGAAHYTSANFAREESEFDACGFTPEYVDGFSAPYVQESRIKIGLELLQEMPIEANGTVLLIGRVEHIYLPEEVLRPDGSLDLVAAGTVCVSGLDGYHAVQAPVRYGYARAGQGPQRLD
ncbi:MULTISPECIES: flavin reductase family protein [Hymenobacter]|uniref:NADH-FMN oxidoreductase RutF, flavin reductase (DIM6/NTAB) family n=1 Tax=Hymenobacter mucosus TaxID=1411120 RepID=A0A238V651_9BACT|nr:MULTISPECIES: flavin reductase [Hymenobacter]SNR29691.1 NADH-FMN oxidoreductase RutF, flavin reductase (DIM6/NTAB) family [Hymenobacter mucosus]